MQQQEKLLALAVTGVIYGEILVFRVGNGTFAAPRLKWVNGSFLAETSEPILDWLHLPVSL